MHVVPALERRRKNFITIIGGSKIIPQLFARDAGNCLATEWAKTAVSNFYLMTPRGLRKSCPRAGREGGRCGRASPPDSITIIGTAGTVIAALTLFPDRAAVVGVRFSVWIFVLAEHARWGDGTRSAAAVTRFRCGAGTPTCEPQSVDGAVFLRGCCGWAGVSG